MFIRRWIQNKLIMREEADTTKGLDTFVHGKEYDEEVYFIGKYTTALNVQLTSYGDNSGAELAYHVLTDPNNKNIVTGIHIHGYNRNVSTDIEPFQVDWRVVGPEPQ